MHKGGFPIIEICVYVIWYICEYSIHAIYIDLISYFLTYRRSSRTIKTFFQAHNSGTITYYISVYSTYLYIFPALMLQ